MTLKQLIKQKALRLESVPATLLSEVEKLQKKIFTDLLIILEQIEKEGGFLKATADNIRKLSDITVTLKDQLFGEDYVNKVSDFIKEFDEQKKIADNLFEKEFKDFQPSDLADTLLEKSKDDALEKLLGSPLDTEFLKPLESILTDSISTGASWRDTVDSIQNFVTGDEDRDGKLLQYSKQIAHDAFAFSDRAYTSAVADELESEWFFYSGGELPTTRCFCSERTEKYFHYKEIEAWARGEDLGECKSGDLWAGAVPATNEKTIFIYAGGFNCQHSILPVSVFSVPADVIKRNLDNGNYTPSEKELELVIG